ncbi:MAG TPA: amidohydrolase [Actinophytocola sp.]|jgi:amidohydrolase|uniref:amidohydrolase n=1 Tax=Actinophytocola sp. TaxID=1872138 RepID=UPI002F949D26
MSVAEADVRAHVQAHATRLWDLALALHRDPETAFDEHRAVERLCAELAEFDIERGVAGLPTAFTARHGSGPGPTVALLLEYDALPGLGHACGHNLIAAAGLGAALAVRDALPDPGGTLLVVGTPAEEGGGGKITEVNHGVFDEVDAALMFHPGAHDWAWAPLTAQVELTVTVHGRAAHPTGNPTEGIDALAGLIQLFTTIAAVRPRLPAGSHIQGIITHGGEATNIVPDRAQARFGLRALTTAALDELAATVSAMAHAVAAATGTTTTIAREREPYHHFRNSSVLADRFAAHLAEDGIVLTEPAPGVFLGSSDIGNVSTVVPAIHPFVAIVGPDESDHTPQFATAAASDRGRATMLAAAGALAGTAVDVFREPALRDAAWAELREAGRRFPETPAGTALA